MAVDFAQLGKDVQQRLSSLVPSDEQARRSLLQSARSLVSALEKPEERVARMCYLEQFVYMSTLIDLKVFNMLASSSGPMTATKLADKAGADPQLLKRLLKTIATDNFVQETGPDEYAANGITKCLATDEAQGTVIDLYNFPKVADILPKYFKDTKYANPTDHDKSPWHVAFETDLPYWKWILQPGNEYRARAFEGHMRFKTLGPKWYEQSEIINEVLGKDGVSENDVLLVDVGGSDGFDILTFHKAHPEQKGRLVLQDLPGTIASLDSKAMAAKGIEVMGHDFFTPQPVKHAKAYYSKMCLHDWPNEQCKEILSNLKPALKPGYSRILLNEIVIPEVKAGWFETSVDLIMMTANSAQERREWEWRELIEGVDGLKVRKIWDVEGAAEKVIEVELL